MLREIKIYEIFEFERSKLNLFGYIEKKTRDSYFTMKDQELRDIESRGIECHLYFETIKIFFLYKVVLIY